jgi:KaiC/GvpD/RAD55 family RecA-like ATPase
MRGSRRDVVSNEVAGFEAIDAKRLDAGDWWANDTEPETTERVTLIEFLWMGLTGAQPVIFVAHEWLQ